MIPLLDRIAGPVLLFALAASLAVNVATWAKLSAERNAHQSFRAATAESLAAAERERANLTESRRKTELELIDAQEAHAAEVASIHSELDAARTAGRVESGRVRDAARAYAHRAGQVCADTTAAELRASAASALDVFADVFSRAEQRATELAGQADERGIAGAACVRLYQEARAALIAAP